MTLQGMRLYSWSHSALTDKAGRVNYIVNAGSTSPSERPKRNG